MSNAKAGVGTLFRRWSGTAWVNIAEINSISGPNMSRDTIDVTSLDSTGGYREFIPGFRDGGTVQLAMNFVRRMIRCKQISKVMILRIMRLSYRMMKIRVLSLQE